MPEEKKPVYKVRSKKLTVKKDASRDPKTASTFKMRSVNGVTPTKPKTQGKYKLRNGNYTNSLSVARRDKSSAPQRGDYDSKTGKKSVGAKITKRKY